MDIYTVSHKMSGFPKVKWLQLTGEMVNPIGYDVKFSHTHTHTHTQMVKVCLKRIYPEPM